MGVLRVKRGVRLEIRSSTGQTRENRKWLRLETSNRTKQSTSFKRIEASELTDANRRSHFAERSEGGNKKSEVLASNPGGCFFTSEFHFRQVRLER